MTADSRDQIYARPLGEVGEFRFDEAVARVFPDMINRSVPGYTSLIDLIGILALNYAQTDSHIYDLGCSLGAATLSMQHRLPMGQQRFIAVDNSAAMIERARAFLNVEGNVDSVELVCADLREVDVHDASVVVLNFTLQFLPPEERLDILQQIYSGMRPGGVLILSEKVRMSEPEQDERFIELHHQFKKANGYSDLEISQKRSALENVLIPETISEHQQRLHSAGFSTVDVWFQCLNFLSLLAIKA